LHHKYAERRYQLEAGFGEEDLKGLHSGGLTLRRARVSDVEEILALVNSYASSNLMLPRGPEYLYENIRDFVVVEADVGRAPPRIVACGSLHVLWEDIAEIRSLATHPQFQHRGLASQIVRYLVGEGRKVGIKKVFAFSTMGGIFEKLGFKPKRKEELPSKVWGECIRCPKYFCCDETGFILDCAD
jgi:amino-acid N-acetyltransferase